MFRQVPSVALLGFVIGTIVGVFTGHFVLALAWGAVFAIVFGVLALLVLGLRQMSRND